jgi:hypothetical protein
MTVFKWSQTAATNATADSTVNWAEGQAPSSVNDSARGMMAAVAKYRDDIAGMLALAGGTTAYTLTTNQNITPAQDGAQVSFQCNATNTGASTLSVDGTTARPMQKIKGTALVAGDLVEGGVYTAVFDTTSPQSWIIHGGRDMVYSADLAAIAALTSAANKLPYATGAGTWAMADLTSAGRQLLDDGDAAAQRTTLGLGTSAVINTGTSGTTIPLLDGANTHSAANSFTSSAGVAARNTAKAFGSINNDGTPTVASGSFNTDSVVLDSTGVCSVTMTNTLGSTNYSVVATPEASSSAYTANAVPVSGTVFTVRTHEITGGGASLANIPFAFVVSRNA